MLTGFKMILAVLCMWKASEATLITSKKKSFFMVLFAFSGRGPHGEAVLQLAFAWGACAVKWGELSKLPKAVLVSELKKAIQEVFPGVVLPEPLDMVFKYWEKVAR